MKALLFVSILIALTSCSTSNYPSLSEAHINCKKWSKKGFEFHWLTEKNEKRSLPNRLCKYEEEKNQFIGYTYKKVKKDKVYASSCDVPKNYVIEKIFNF